MANPRAVEYTDASSKVECDVVKSFTSAALRQPVAQVPVCAAFAVRVRFGAVVRVRVMRLFGVGA
jgi:hypothetical protein